MDSALQFHGPPRVWDGKTIRRILNGKSTLYIVMEEIQVHRRTVILCCDLSLLFPCVTVDPVLSGTALSGHPVSSGRI